jgi:hypothetical protein
MNFRRHNDAALLLLLVLTLTSATSWAAAASSLRLVAQTGKIYQGTTGPRSFSSFNASHVDAKGSVTFDVSYSTNIWGTTDIGIWSERSGGQLTELVHSGDLHPAGTTPYRFLLADSFSDEGTIAFTDEIPDAPNGPRKAIWVGLPGEELRLVAVNKPLSGVTVPEVYDFGNYLRVQDVSPFGHVAMTSTTNWIYLASPDGSVRTIAGSNIPVPGIPGAQFGSLTMPRLNDHGQIVWRSLLSNVEINTQFSIWKELTPNDRKLVARQGNVAPGTAGDIFYRFYTSSLDNAGNVAFSGQTFSSGFGLWTETTAQGMRSVFVEGDAAPGTELGVTFGNNGPTMAEPAYGSSGDIAFRSRVVGPGTTVDNNSGIWAFDGDDLRLVARAGSPAPGTDPGVVFGGLYSSSTYSVNQRGQVAFLGFLTGPGVNDNNSRGLWAETPQGELKLIARQGDVFTNDQGQQSILYGLSFVPSGFGDNGHLVFRASFRGTNDWGVFVSNLVAVPEPNCLALSTMVLISFVKRPRGRGPWAF